MGLGAGPAALRPRPERSILDLALSIAEHGDSLVPSSIGGTTHAATFHWIGDPVVWPGLDPGQNVHSRHVGWGVLQPAPREVRWPDQAAADLPGLQRGPGALLPRQGVRVRQGPVRALHRRGAEGAR